MGVPTSEVGYTSAMPRREDHEFQKNMWGHGGEKNSKMIIVFSSGNVIGETNSDSSGVTWVSESQLRSWMGRTVVSLRIFQSE